MAANFKAEFWSAYCQTEIQNALVLGNYCDYKFEGEITLGARLHIVGAVRPTVGKYIPGKDIDIEKLKDNNQFLDVDQSDYIAFEVDDLEKAQSKKGYLDTQFDEAKFALAESADKYVGSLAQKAIGSMKSASTELSSLSNPLSIINTGFTALYKNGVPNTQKVEIDLEPTHYMLVSEKLTSLSTNNSELIKKGAYAEYNNGLIKMSNNLFNDGTDTYEMIRTNKAFAFVNQVEKMEHCRKEKGFATIIKGLHVYGAKLLRPKELYVMRVH